MSLEEVYQRGLELLDRFYARVGDGDSEKKTTNGKSWPTYNKQKKCAYPGCDRMIIAKGLRSYCPEHTEVRRKEHLKRGWDKDNKKRRDLRKALIIF